MSRAALPLWITRASVLASLLCAGQAYAQDDAHVAAAESLFQEAEALEAQGRFELACGKYAESHELDPGLGTLLHLAHCYEQAGKNASAWGRYREAWELALTRSDPRSKVAKERADRLEPLVAKLTVIVPQAAEVPGLTITRGGRTVGKPQFNTALPIDPGTHTLVISAARYLPQELSVTVPNGRADLRLEVPVLQLDPAKIEQEPARREEAPTGLRAHQWAGIGVGGAGALALIAGGVLGLTAKAQYDKSDANCNDNLCSQAGLDARDSAKGQATASTVLFIAGGTLLAGGAVLFFLPAGKKSDQASLAPRWNLSPTGISVSGRF